jgi:hypothetical protein
MADKFDGKSSEGIQRFDINSWAREFFIEANRNLLRDEKFAMKLLDDMRVNVEETTLSGSIERFTFRNASIPKNMFL